MKHLISTLVLIVCGMFCTQFVFCDTIPTKGEWSIEDFRSVVPAPPTASIEGKVLTINFVNPLANLTVKVTDNETGQTVYEECISASAPQSHSVLLNADNGKYTLSLTHALGYLTGEFTIE
ncbi:DUF3244 domain-containing protein [uncultured Parabacteroides sp.]|uniref:DUF3244 domain-containing protein n=1 Tax=uncultured Parabacteroides sp. TaxID=512312 RepID=UPI0025F89FAD|nr:DUF3244 domain-containing protein [uncultured Parabacteroides sp.]